MSLKGQGVKNILLVEDSKYFAAVIMQTLSRMEWVNIHWASDLVEAKEALSNPDNKFHLTLLDLSLPDAHGIEIVQAITNFNVPIVVFTGTFDLQLSKSMFDLGVVDYVIKGGKASFEYIYSVVRRVLINQDIKVLIVDDTKIGRILLSEMCRRYQLNVIEACDGEDALQKLKENPDIKMILTDYNMPKMDGFELTKNIREEHPKSKLAIIAVSSSEQQGLSAQFIKIGANDFISKPFDAEEFYCRVSQNLDYLEHIEQLENLASYDFLTGLRNRRSFFEVTEPLLSGLDRRKVPPVAAMLDVDHFKKINDTFGHDVGDQVLILIGNVLSENIRKSDVLARTGGEEFAILATDMDVEKVEEKFDHIRQAVNDVTMEIDNEIINPTISIGVYVGHSEDADELLSYADKCLYEAKENGRNKVVVKYEEE
ncbi:diguanylate cyclase [Pseudemcibacter aquimaris]|uniref:GGDEF domain-containing response regulator n=1 Tax=Pseudemcibacter aquimaris TaxID=2857064 RepID=UPI00201191F0|nr:diguanylate cyclase [Pseudemcibacter aquimaris]MCC3861226.1 diguanylate cyclase [Pseudemcibacter aquimaris]WDU58001.1 diguanylate cyclase [Pseudemcibacter aquimaris]